MLPSIRRIRVGGGIFLCIGSAVSWGWQAHYRSLFSGKFFLDY